jgi:hypothetical protein
MTLAQTTTLRVLESDGWTRAGFTCGVDGRDTKRVLMRPRAGSESSFGVVMTNGNLHQYFRDPASGYQARRITVASQFAKQP